MSEQIIKALKRKIDDVHGELDVEARRNVIKEELQLYVLDFIYHHHKYSKWIMYGGSALRIIHGLDRMSVDLDFEVSHAITEKFLNELENEIKKYFKDNYGAEDNFLTVKTVTKRGLILKFDIGKELSLNHPSRQVHVKIDLNHFVALKTIHENRLISRNQLSFVILVYNMSTLMASKIAAIFLRETRGIDKNIYCYKGRDIYDLLWYMSKKIVPDFDYINAKMAKRNKKALDIKTLFNKLTIDLLNYKKMEDCLKADLSYLFEDPLKFEIWLKNWRKDYLRLLDDYKIRTVTELDCIEVHCNLMSDNLYFTYMYKTKEEQLIRIVYVINEDWIESRNNDLPIKEKKKIKDKIEFTSDRKTNHPLSKEKLIKYATLFYEKTESYFKKTNHIMLGDIITTKIIRMTTDNLNPKEQVVLNKSTLLSCELDDLLK